MLTLKCAACKRKLWKYNKVGTGEVLRCHKDWIKKLYAVQHQGNKIQCSCGKDIGIDKGGYYKMIAKAFTFSGRKQPGCRRKKK